MGELLPKATFSEALSHRGWLPHAFGKPLMLAVAEGYALPTGKKVDTFISDSRMGEAEARRINQFMDVINPGMRKRRILSLFDGAGVTSFALAYNIPTAQVTGVELDHETHIQGVHNIRLANLTDRVNLVEENAVSYLESAPSFDAIFVDPPWPDNMEGSSGARFSLSDTTPNNKDIIRKATEHSSIVVTRVPLNVDMAEIVALSENLETELYIDIFRIKEPGVEPQITLYFVKTGTSGVSVRDLVLEPRQTAWNISDYPKSATSSVD